MASSNACWGIEIGASAIKGLKLVNEGDRLRIADFIWLPHPKPASSPDVDPNEVIRLGINSLAAQADLSKAAIAVSVPGHMAFARFAKLPPVEAKKVPDIVKFEAMQQIPFPLEQVEWDYQTFVSPDSPDIEVGIFAITKERINERLTMLQDAGIKPDFVTLSPISVFNALAYDLDFTDKTAGTVIVDVGTTSTDLVVADAGRMWIRTFPIGGHQFTQAIVDAFKVSYQKAEKIKREAQETAHAKQVFAAMRPVFTDLAQDIQRSIQYYQSLHRDAKLTRLIGVGGTFELPGLRKFLKQQVQMEVYKVEEFKKLKLDDVTDPARQQALKESTLGLVTAYGLALQGLGQAAIAGNLMPVEVLRKAMWKDKVKWFGLAAGLALAGSAAMFIRPFTDDLAVKEAMSGQEPITIDRIVAEASQRKNEATEAGVIGGASPDYRASNLAGLLEHRDLHARLVHDLGLMLASADAAAASWSARGPDGNPLPKAPGPAYSLKSFETTYTTPDAGGDPAAMGDPNAAPAGAAGPELPPELAQQPRVSISLRVATNQPDPQKFIIETLQRWLRENRERPDVPYVIVAEQTPWIMSGAPSAGSPLMGSGPSPAMEPPGRGGRMATAPGARDREAMEQEMIRRQTAERVRGVISVETGRVLGGGPGGGAPGAGGAGGGEASSVAPFASLKEAAGATPEPTAVFDVTWTVVIKPKQPEGGA